MYNYHHNYFDQSNYIAQHFLRGNVINNIDYNYTFKKTKSYVRLKPTQVVNYVTETNPNATGGTLSANFDITLKNSQSLDKLRTHNRSEITESPQRLTPDLKEAHSPPAGFTSKYINDKRKFLNGKMYLNY